MNGISFRIWVLFNSEHEKPSILLQRCARQAPWPSPYLDACGEEGAGLQNLGNTCFLNFVLQCLTYTEPLAAYLQSRRHKISCIVIINMECKTCVAGAINNFTNQLSHYSDGSSDRRHNMIEALLFLSHFMGDIHQPLHVVHCIDDNSVMKSLSLAGTNRDRDIVVYSFGLFKPPGDFVHVLYFQEISLRRVLKFLLSLLEEETPRISLIWKHAITLLQFKSRYFAIISS